MDISATNRIQIEASGAPSPALSMERQFSLFSLSSLESGTFGVAVQNLVATASRIASQELDQSKRRLEEPPESKP